ncbi:glycine cleavage system aminomethyltransferase GcvT [Caproiciproducens sp. NJN-50]|uniref:glycine cleavage system aminomethyltransferase GcvT n=1 Tax=Acutalibacteraceae TaxID=3082771 RepID=UPI000FFDFDD2|nr:MULTISPECIES: glycine cleavage system aminomethyltransferase GcvT [Acutalibacteraceae]QAT49166.1 glycine cleavage system aminomethyltransferase GcvT [Caproiciproducens sp. NJN-50]
MELKTPLYSRHVSAGGKIVPFAGYLLPVQYPSGVIAEHMAVRTAAGLFDISHMGEIILEGKDALANLHHLLTNDFTSMYDGRVRYTLMCYEDGGVVDDLVVCRISETKYLLVVNAANRRKDAEWIRTHLTGEVRFEDVSDRVAQIALQGPKAPEILKKLAEESSIPQKYYTFVEKGTVGGVSCLVSRTGYTGELGYEFYCAPQDAERLWDLLLEAGKEYGLIPCGLGARDTLRLEAAMPLYGHEMDETVNPFEAGLSFGVKMDSHDFIGKEVLSKKMNPSRVRIGLTVTGRGIARGGEPVLTNGSEIGKTTSGTFCPYLKEAVAMALVDSSQTKVGAEVELEIRGRCVAAKITALPFYKRS